MMLLSKTSKPVGHARLFSTAVTRMAGQKSYADAIATLNTLQASHATILARKTANKSPNANSLGEMRHYLDRLGHQQSALSRLNAAHVAGTKGKGSTCAYVAAILSAHKKRTSWPGRVGLLTSPHLMSVRERIRIDGQPLAEDLFARYFFEVFNALEKDRRPGYARFLTLMAYHVFIRENISAAVIETGIGGEYDATNVINHPAATGITHLGIDHVAVLGSTIDKIAWHKAGIMKHGSAAFSVCQVKPIATEVLQARAADKDVPLKFVGIDPRLSNVRIRPDADFQRQNASLAIALAEAVLKKADPTFEKTEELPEAFVDGLENVVWRGRCEVKKDDRVTWHLDGAHTIDSINVCATWFAGESKRSNATGPRVLIFNQQGRSEAVDFLNAVYDITTSNKAPFDHVIFCTNIVENAKSGDLVNNQVDPKELSELRVQNTLAQRWRQIDPEANVSVAPSVNKAIDQARGLIPGLAEGESVQVLVTGSLHLVGAVLSALESSAV